MYTFIVFLIHLYSTTGRNAANNAVSNDTNIEMTTGGLRSKWYARVPNADASRGLHVIGDDEEDD